METLEPAEIERLLVRVERRARERKTQVRAEVRSLLLAIGTASLTGDAATAAELSQRLRRATEPDREGFDGGVLDELTLAVAEHTRSVDPRWLKHPSYDLRYTVDARERLEARLRAVEELELVVPEDLLEQVARADVLLEPLLRERDRRE